jgi:Rrf2 family transcriptional regulator, nitric oxide-sensitive transcriptional repressor
VGSFNSDRGVNNDYCPSIKECRLAKHRRAGGVTLGRPAEDIHLGDVVRTTEPDFALVECFSTGSECVIGGCCRLPAVLRRALGAFIGELDRHTVASIALRPKDFRKALQPEARQL